MTAHSTNEAVMTMRRTDIPNLVAGCRSTSVGKRLYNTLVALETKTDAITTETASAGAKVELPEATANGTDKVIFQAPASLGADRTITIPDADVDLTEVAANTLKTAMLTREVAASGGKIDLLEGTDNGTDKVTLQAPAALTADRTITIPDADVDLTEIGVNSTHTAGDGSDHGDVAANTTLTAMLTREVAASGGKIELLEGTDNGTDKVVFQAPATLGADRTITIPDADVDLTYLDQDVGIGSSPSLAKVLVTDTAGAAVGTVVAEEQGTAGRKVVLTFTDETVAVLDNPATVGYLGLKIFDLPEGLIFFVASSADLVITKDSAGVDDDWNGDFGVGTITAAGSTPLAGAEQDLIPTTATPQATAGATSAKGASTDTEAGVIHDGTTTAKDVYLNILVDDGDQDVTTTPCNFILNGTITLCYMQCGDF